MSNPIPILGLLLALVLFGGSYFHQKLCCGESAATTAAATTAVTTTTAATAATADLPAGLAIADGSAFRTTAKGNLIFPVSGFEYEKPLSTELNDAYASTAEYLKAHPDRAIDITGYYTSDENNPSPLPNLGVARANQVKQILMGMGVAAGQINTMGELRPSLDLADGEITGGINYGFSELIAETAVDNLAALRDKIKGRDVVLNFETNQQEISLTANERQYFADLISYLDQVPTAKVKVSGHTDNRGSDQLNRRLSRKRAEFARDYLVKNGGIKANKITVAFHGPDIPVATNDTPEGRAKNRRTEIRLVE